MSQAELSKAVERPGRLVSLSHDHLSSLGASRDLRVVLADLGEQAAASGLDQTLTVDLSEIERIMSIGLNELIGLNSQARSLGVRLVLLDVPSAVHDVFKLTRLERMFEFAVANPSS